MDCIFCGNENNAISIEHIVPESLGNHTYVAPKSSVCDACNRRFSVFEEGALTKSVFTMERARFGVPSKKGKNVKGKIKEIEITGDENFKKNSVIVKGLSEENFKNFNPETQRGFLYVDTFDKSPIATAKTVLKMGLESIYTSRRNLYHKYDFSELTDYLNTITNVDWPFLSTDYEPIKFTSVPRFTEKYNLNKVHCVLNFLEVDDETLLFKFKYGVPAITLNLLNRNLGWINQYLDNDRNASLFPEHYKAKYEKQKIVDTKNKIFE